MLQIHCTLVASTAYTSADAKTQQSELKAASELLRGIPDQRQLVATK